MESSKLEIVLHHGKDLRDVKHLSPMNPYAIVWIAEDGKENYSKHTTPIAENGACDPEWEYSMDFIIESLNQESILFFEILHDGTLFDRKIGEVQVPFEDLLAKDGPRDKVSYQVTTPSGEEKGEIVVSHKLVIMSSDEDEGMSEDDTSKVESSPGELKKIGGIAKMVAKKVTETVILSGVEVATTFVLETFEQT